MTEPGLARVAPSLVPRLVSGSADYRRQVVHRACVAAVERTGLSGPDVQAAVAAIAAKTSDAALQAKIDELTEELDSSAWQVQDAVESGSVDGANYEEAFQRARASATLGFGLTDSLQSAFDALYEAYYAIADQSTFEQTWSGVPLH